MTDSLSDFGEYEVSISDCSNITEQDYHPKKDLADHEMLSWNVISLLIN